jgi:hypothetical protein
MCTPILAAEESEGGRAAFVGPSVLRLTFLLTSQLAGVRPGPFSQFSLLGGYLTALSEGAFGYQPSPDPSRTRHPFHGGGPARGARVAASGCRPVNLKLRKHLERQFSNAAEHLYRLSCAGFDDPTETQTRGRNLGTPFRPESS